MIQNEDTQTKPISGQDPTYQKMTAQDDKLVKCAEPASRPDETVPSSDQEKETLTKKATQKKKREKKVKTLTADEVKRAQQVIVEGEITHYNAAPYRARCFLDTGSQINLINWTTVCKMGLASNINETMQNLRDFGGNSIPCRGTIMVTLNIGGLSKWHSFAVCDGLDTDLLLGDPFFKGQVVIDYVNGELRIEGAEPVPFQPRPTSTKRVHQIKWSETTCIPPHTMMLVAGSLAETPTGSIGLISPDLTRGQNDVYVAEAIAEASEEKVVLKILNMTGSEVELKQGSRAAKFSPVPDYDPHAGIKWEDRYAIGSEIPEKERWTKEELFERLSVDVAIRNLTDLQAQELKDILWEHRKCFSYDDCDLGSCTMYTAKIRLKEGAEPQWTPPFPCPYKLEDEMQRNIDEMVRTGVVEVLPERSDWNSPTFLVKKKTPPGQPQRYRMVADLRNVNKVSLPSNFPLAHLDHVLDKIGKDTIFSSFDLSRGYWQLPYDEASKQITAFLYKNTQYAYAKTVMGHRSRDHHFVT
eukprot:sb/3463812/